MKRALVIALCAALSGCSKGDSDSSDDEGCGALSDWVPGGAGEADPTLGATLTYPNGHSLNWLETNQVVIDQEMELIDMINAYRADRDLPALEYDKELTRCARGHSRHHEEHGGFQGHTNPEGDDFVERMARNGIASTIWGENIVYGAFHVTVAFDGWVNSAPHRENLLRECFTRIGVGMHMGVWTAKFAR